MIKSLTPYYVNTPFVSARSGLTCTAYTIKIYVWNGAKNNRPISSSYEITKPNPTGSTSSDKINIANIVKSFIDFVPYKSNATALIDGNNQKWIRVETYYTTTDPVDATVPQYVYTDLLVHGYGYGLDGENPGTPTNKVHVTGDQFNVNRSGYLCLPIEREQTTITFGAVADTIAFYFQDTLFDVLANDDLGYTPTSIILLSYAFPTDYGTLSIVSNKVQFTAGVTFDGSAQTFDYTIRDSTGQESTATATITATALPATATAVDDSFTVNTTDVVIFSVLSNDSLGTTPTTITSVVQTGLTGGVITITGSGSTLTFTPNGTTPATTETFTYTITDNIASTDTATVTLTYLTEGRYLTSLTSTDAFGIATITGYYNYPYEEFSFLVKNGKTINVNRCVIESTVSSTNPSVTRYNWNDAINCAI